MTLNHSKSVKTVLCISFFWYGKHSRDTTVLIDLCHALLQLVSVTVKCKHSDPILNLGKWIS